MACSLVPGLLAFSLEKECDTGKVKASVTC
jgi:hypothetical protein